MSSYITNDTKEKVWKHIVKLEGLPKGCRAAMDLEQDTEEAIEHTMILTAQEIFASLEKEVLNKLEDSPANIVTKEQIERIKGRWLHNVCDVCETRKNSVVFHRKTGKRLCASCEVIDSLKQTPVK